MLRPIFLMTLTACILAACSDEPDSDRFPEPPRLNIPFTPEVSINEIMVAQIDHAAHFIWAASDQNLPEADVDWIEVEHHAIQLISSRAAMTMGGTGVNDAMWVAQPSWRDYVRQMSAAALDALDSARQQDQAGLNVASARLLQTCESCHQQFQPEIPTEGYRKQH